MKSLKHILARVAMFALLMPVASGLAQNGSEDGMAKSADTVKVVMTTSMGEIVLELDPDKAPVSTANFISYVDKGFYNGTIFHRVMPGFMIQGGGFTPDMNQKATDAPIKNEWKNGLKNVRGSISMARTQVADSATSQFFINVVDNAALDTPRDGAAYAVFGRVVSGMEVVDKIKDVATTTSGQHANVPATPVVIEKVTWSGPETLEALRQRASAAMEKEAAALRELGAKSRNEGIKYVESLGVNVSTGASSDTGLWFVDTVVGEGAQPTPQSKVRVHYTGWLTTGAKFDSSRDRGQPAEFPLNRVIKGWTEGVSGMKVGGKRYLVVPPQLGYGASSPTPKIPPNSTLVFEVELLDIISD
jgi:cyclophilin family peptidyl-prolyl cis-trans isomerase